jgi:hypothetical protein
VWLESVFVLLDMEELIVLKWLWNCSLIVLIIVVIKVFVIKANVYVMKAL